VTGTVLGCIPTALFYALAADWSMRAGSVLPALGLGVIAFSIVAWLSFRSFRNECPENTG